MRIIADLNELTGLVATEVAVSDWFGVDQDRVARFAEATNDRQWIHLDADRARRESPYRTTIAHGFLTLSLLPYFLEQTLRIDGLRLLVNYGLNRVRFPAPVPVGSRVRARVALAALEPIAGGAQLEWQVTVERENESKPACVASLLVRCYV
ncbi:MAG: MaoC family dehydratase [Steroidobacteraceae bacterium]|jgi:acyl dehydratase